MRFSRQHRAGDRQAARGHRGDARTPIPLPLLHGRSDQNDPAGSLAALSCTFVEEQPPDRGRRLARLGELRQNRHDLGAVFGGVVDHLGENDCLWHFMHRAVPVDLHGVVGLHLRRPLNEARASRTHRFHHFRYRQRGCGVTSWVLSSNVNDSKSEQPEIRLITSTVYGPALIPDNVLVVSRGIPEVSKPLYQTNR